MTSLSLSLSCMGEGKGNPLQCSSLENPRDSGAWWAAIYGVLNVFLAVISGLDLYDKSLLCLNLSSILAWTIPWTEEPSGL